MSAYKLGFVGCGNMGRAMLNGILKAGLLKPEDVIVSVGFPAEVDTIRDVFKVEVVMDNAAVAEKAQTIILATKPNMLDTVLPELRSGISEESLLISIAAGKSIRTIEESLEKMPEGQKITSIEDAIKKKVALIRVMPNVNAMVGEAMSALCPNENVTEEQLAFATEVFSCFGRAEIVPEGLMDTVTGLSGSAPAFVFSFIEALADGAVAEGLPRAQAYTFAAQTVLGSAKMVLQTSKHPGELKDMVCSPGGTTIEGIASLEENGFRHAAISAVRAATKKSKKLGTVG